MKKALILILSCFIYQIPLCAQSRYGIGIGLGSSIVHYPKGLSHPESLVVPTIKLQVEHNVLSSWAGCIEFGFMEQGYKDNKAIYVDVEEEMTDLTVRQFCSDLSISVKHDVASSFFVKAGIYTRYLLYSNVTSDNKALPSNRYGKLNKLDIGPQIAIGEVYDKFFIELSYKYGLLGCYKRVDWYNHNSILFSIGFYW